MPAIEGKTSWKALCPPQMTFQLMQDISEAVKLNFQPYIRRYTSPNENFQYSYLLNQHFTVKSSNSNTFPKNLNIMTKQKRVYSSYNDISVNYIIPRWSNLPQRPIFPCRSLYEHKGGILVHNYGEEQFPDMGSFSLNRNFSYTDPL